MGSVAAEIQFVTLLEHMHWTIQDYEAQPPWIIQALRVKMEEDTYNQRAKK